MEKRRRHTEGKFVGGFARYFVAMRLIKARNWNEMVQSLARSRGHYDPHTRLLFGELQMLNLCSVIQYELCTLLENLFRTGQIQHITEIESAILERCPHEGRGRLRRKYGKDFSAIWFIPPILLDEANYGLGGLWRILKEHSQLDFGHLGLSEDDFEKFREARNQICHNPCSSRRMPRGEMSKAITAGKRIHETLDTINEHFSQDETRKLIHRARSACALCASES